MDVTFEQLFFLKNYCFSPLPLSRGKKWKLDQESQVFPRKWETAYFLTEEKNANSSVTSVVLSCAGLQARELAIPSPTVLHIFR